MALTAEQYEAALAALTRTNPNRAGAPVYAPEIRDYLKLTTMSTMELTAGGHVFKVYRFEAPDMEPGAPLFVNIHGGGWYKGHLDNDYYHSSWLAAQIRGVVLSVDYTTSRYAAFDVMFAQCCAAVAWAFEHAQELGCDPARISVGGYSAGGHLTAGAALWAANEGGLKLHRQIIAYGPVDFGDPAGGEVVQTEGPVASGARGQAFNDLLFRREARYLADPYANPLHAPDEMVAKVCPALIITADRCNFTTQDNLYANRIAMQHIDVTTRHFAGTPHGFIPHFGPCWREASELMVREITARPAAEEEPAEGRMHE